MDNTKSSNYIYAQKFNSDVVKWRQTAAKLWSILIIFTLILTHSVTTNYNPLTNLTGFIMGFFANLFSFQFWLFSTVILAMFWLLFTFNDKLFQVCPKVYLNNLEKLLDNVYSLQSVCIAANAASSLFMSYLLLKFYDQDAYKMSYFYICGFCMLSHFMQQLQFLFEDKYILNWPIIEQTKYVRFKSKLYGAALSCLKSVFLHMFIWKIVYFFMGSCLLNNLFAAKSNESDTLSSFMTTFIAIKIAFLLNFAHSISWIIYEIYLTEIYHFNIQQTVNSQICLPVAMSLNTHSYIQTLAFIDFADLSIYSKTKRKQLFSLSYTNSKPVNWTKVSTEALGLLKNFMEIFNFDDMLHGTGAGKVSQLLDSPQRFPTSTLIKRTNVTSPLRDSMNLLLNSELNYLKSPKVVASQQQQQQSQQANSLWNSSAQKMLAFLKTKKKYLRPFIRKTQTTKISSFLSTHFWS